MQTIRAFSPGLVRGNRLHTVCGFPTDQHRMGDDRLVMCPPDFTHNMGEGENTSETLKWLPGVARYVEQHGELPPGVRE